MELSWKKYWKSKWANNDLDEMKNINWEAFRRLHISVSQNKRIWRIKHMANIDPTRMTMKNRKQQKDCDNATCPTRCNLDEDNLHTVL